VSSGVWNASLDLWFDPTKRTNGRNTGAELMIWAHHMGPAQPVGQKKATVTLEGAQWDVWTGNIGHNVISYVRQQPTDSMKDFSIKAFVNDAVARGQIDPTHYMTSVQAGFEPWVGGTGLAVKNFSFTANAIESTPAVKTGQIKGLAGGCLDRIRASDANGVPVVIAPCTGRSQQKWTISDDGTLRAYGRCLSVRKASVNNAAKLNMWDCSDAAHQKWTVHANGNLRNAASGKCLDVFGAPSSSRNNLQIYSCGASQPNQRWVLPS
ncbi:MAG: GH12 family glycosyl hydrolase domain-containing protein, partial [Rhodoglobus sp.]